ncbi:hypothetical protein ACTXT7_000402 [Hymenolepis weldensis]
MSKRAHRFPPLYNGLVSPKRYICAHVLARPYPNDSYKAIFVFHSKENAVSTFNTDYRKVLGIAHKSSNRIPLDKIIPPYSIEIKPI